MRATGPSTTIIQHLKSLGIKIRHPKKSPSPNTQRKTSSNGLFGIPLHSLQLSHIEGNVPQFVVDTCQFLSCHLCTEGLFRKSGSVTRIKNLKVQLESRECSLVSAQPGDVAALLKQFFRELPRPLIPLELQDPLCQIQELLNEDKRGSATIMVTCLLPDVHVGTLKYFCTFLQSVASMCDENRMNSANLAVVLAPNLFSSSGMGERLTHSTEKQLQLQTSVMQTLIENAGTIGILPSFILNKIAFSIDGADEDSVAPSGGVSRRRRRRSMSGFVNEALSKFKSGRTASITEPDQAADEDSLSERNKSKRKASEDTSNGNPCMAKKRKSLRDVTDDQDLCESLDILSPQRVYKDTYPKSPSIPLGHNTESPATPITPECYTRGPRTRGKWKDNKRTKRRNSGLSCVSPAQLERKEKVRSSMRLFKRMRTAKEPSLDGKNMENSGWNMMKRIVTEALEGPIFNGRDFRIAPLSLKAEQAHPLISESASFDCTSSKHCLSSTPFWKPLAKGVEQMIAAPSSKKKRTLRRSLSMPENVGESTSVDVGHEILNKQEGDFSLTYDQHSFSDTRVADTIKEKTKKKGLDCERPSKLSPTKLNIDCINSFNRQVSVSELHHSSQPLRTNGHIAQYRSVQKLVLKFPWVPNIMANDPHQKDWKELASYPIKRKGARRFGRSISHESGLYSTEDQNGENCGRVSSSISPTASLRGCNRKVYVSRKNITLSNCCQRSLEISNTASLDSNIPDSPGQPFISYSDLIDLQVMQDENRTLISSPKHLSTSIGLKPINDCSTIF
ncbi:hypothetical protein GDO86_015792 [Hymenochirus boettgeri]|uniref:Rho-GAP domain-containing protein n=1 Tax=Hymenochirus boettgeri TaxID=247094 RepID=A0A8T2K2I0_9PIPI|nr:hypothetical protein GDO86_015792 [Hymenochirus boettgeri]